MRQTRERILDLSRNSRNRIRSSLARIVPERDLQESASDMLVRPLGTPAEFPSEKHNLELLFNFAIPSLSRSLNNASTTTA